MNARLQRRVSMHVRHDAAEQLGNGRVLYDALFSRTGIQTYGDSVEYRPDSEVFAEASRATGALCPGVLLHPSQNFGTKFDGKHSPKGCTGDQILVHADGIHTTGKLCVWDDAWNEGIRLGTVAELSVGYTIRADRTPGTAPDGTRYDVVHRDIIWDHVAGVPAGNAGTARVVTDAHIPFATRAALADMAAARMDAKPLYFDLGRWPHRDPPREETQPMADDIIAPNTKQYVSLAAAKIDALGPTPTAKQVNDVWIDVMGSSDDPAMLRVCAALGSMEATGTSGGAPMMDAAQLEQQRHDIAEAADERADVLELARRVFGVDFAHRTPMLDSKGEQVLDAAGKPRTAPKQLEAMKRDIVAKLDASRLTLVDAYPDGPRREVALDMQLAEVRKIFDARTSKAPIVALLATIEQTRDDNGKPPAQAPTPEQVQVADRLAAQADPNRQPIFGREPPPAAAPAR